MIREERGTAAAAGGLHLATRVRAPGPIKMIRGATGRTGTEAGFSCWPGWAGATVGESPGTYVPFWEFANIVKQSAMKCCCYEERGR